MNAPLEKSTTVFDAITNDLFLEAIFGDASKAWTQTLGKSDYFCIAKVNGNRNKDNFEALHCVVIDDVGTKCENPPTQPNWIIETSQGNYQWGYILQKPIECPEQATLLTYSSGEYGDGGAKDIVRLMKLPQGVHSEKTDSQGQPWLNRLTYWKPELRDNTRLNFLAPYADKVKAKLYHADNQSPQTDNPYKYDEVTLIGLAARYDPNFLDLLHDKKPNSESDFQFMAALLSAGATVGQVQNIYQNSSRYRDGKVHGQSTTDHFVKRIARVDAKTWFRDYSNLPPIDHEHIEWLKKNLVKNLLEPDAPTGCLGISGWDEEPDWVIEDVVESNQIGYMYGESESFKSFTAIDMCGAIATGSPWVGHDVEKQGLVLYIASEGERQIKRRFRAWEIQHNTALGDNLAVLSGVLPLNTEAGLKQVTKYVDENLPSKPVMIVIDTVGGHISGSVND
ncbi:AAA family ATPase [Vibrio parahaemolyticus]|nr:AAA family ATPase [Vibrio parahaemolyticus]